MSEHIFSYPKIDRRHFLSRAGIALGGAAAAGMGATLAAHPPRASWLIPVPAGDSRIGQLKRLRSARIAERTFGTLDWSAVRATTLNRGSDAMLNQEHVYYVPINTRSETTSLLVLSSAATDSRERRGLARLAARSGDGALFSDDLVVQLARRGEPELRWSTVDGRLLTTRHASGELRLGIAAAGSKLARSAGHPGLSLAAGMAACGDAGPELRRGERLPLALYRAGASGKRRIRSCGAPVTRR